MKTYPSEHYIQTDSIALFRNEYERKGLGVIIPVPNELAAKRKDITIKEGCSDTIVLFNGCHFVEFKTGYNNQSPGQKIFQSQVELLGYSYNIIRSVVEFKELMLTFAK